MILEGAGSENRATRSAGDAPGLPARWVPFSHRYGLARGGELARWCAAGGEDYLEERWRSRHDPMTSNVAGLEDQLLRCVCPGVRREAPVLPFWRCSERASQEDRLCDACREHCWGAGDGTGERVRLVDAYGAAT